MSRFLDLSVFLISLAAIGVGVALKDPAWALVVVGSLGIVTVFVSNLRSKPLPPPGESE